MINYFYVENAFDGENVLTLDSSYGTTADKQPGLQLWSTTTPDVESSWTAVTFATDTKKATINIPQSGKVYLRGTNQTLSKTKHFDTPIISCTSEFNVGGDLTTLLKPEGNVLDLTGRDYVFFNLFFKTNVVDASKLILPSTILSEGCYVYMFFQCEKLTVVPKNLLPAIELTDYCYDTMFNGCTALTTAPELPATILPTGCYRGMFGNCESLIKGPSIIPAKKTINNAVGNLITNGCCFGMFVNCPSLIQAPELSATELSPYCYFNMFEQCRSLTQAPELPATVLVEGCYKNMFGNCRKLNKVTALFTDNSAPNCLRHWLYGVSPTGTFIHNPEVSQVVLDSSEIPSGWTRQAYVKPVNYFYVENAFDGENILNIQNTEGRNLEYSTNGQTWNTYDFTTQPKLAKLGDRVYLRGTNKIFGNNKENVINCSQPFNASGDVTTLLVPEGNILDLTGRDGTFRNLFVNSNLVNIDNIILPSTILAPWCYFQMFGANTVDVVKITSAPKSLLPAMILAPWCYAGMFQCCNKLTSVPMLPAMTMYDNCYRAMFNTCSSLVDAPTLPATELSKNCYNYMFGRCESLTTAPTLPATVMAESCYNTMFARCSSLVNAPALPAMELAIECYQGMFVRCTSLVNIPKLPATVMKKVCYKCMFENCWSISEIPDNYLPATELAEGCYCLMFHVAKNLNKVPKKLLHADILVKYCYSGMFCDCTSLTTSPELPATKLADFCYGGDPRGDAYGGDYAFGMFKGCTSLNNVTSLFSDNSAQGCLDMWLDNVSTTGTFIHNPAISSSVLNDKTIIPEKWDKTPIETPTCFRVNSTESNTLTIESTANPVIKYSTDNKTWTEYKFTTPATQVNFSGTLYLCGANNDLSTTTFKFTKPISTDADITTLLNGIGGKELPQDVFKDIFKGNTITEIRVKGNNLTNRAQTYVYDNSNVQQVILHILNKDNKTYSEWTANIGSNGKLTNLARIGLVK